MNHSFQSNVDTLQDPVLDEFLAEVKKEKFDVDLLAEDNVKEEPKITNALNFNPLNEKIAASKVVILFHLTFIK